MRVFNRLDQLQFLPRQLLASFLSEIIQRKAEIISDRKEWRKFIGSYLSFDGKSSADNQSVLVFLLSHVLAAQSDDMKLKILTFLQQVQSSLKLQLLAPLLQKAFEENRSPRLICALIRLFTPNVKELLEEKGSKYFSLYSKAFEMSSDVVLAALEQMTPQFFASLASKRQKSVLDLVIRVVYDSSEATLVERAKKDLKLLSLSDKHYADQLLTCGDFSVQDNSATSKKRSKRSEDGQVNYEKLVVLLELMLGSTIPNAESLALPLFNVFGFLIHQEKTVEANVEYLKQLLLDNLLKLCKSLATSIDESSLRVDHVVSCIRTSMNPQTHNSALLLLAEMASMYPSLVLSSVLPVFTFMGAHILRQDDNYSFYVIQRTLELILPVFIKSSEEQDIKGTAFESFK